MRTRKAASVASRPAAATLAPATSSASATVSGARRRSAGASSAARAAWPADRSARLRRGTPRVQRPSPARSEPRRPGLRYRGQSGCHKIAERRADSVCSRRGTGCPVRTGASHPFPKISAQLLPPKPNELLSTRLTRRVPVPGGSAGRRRIERGAVEGARHQAVLERQQADHRFHDAGRAERMAGEALGGAGVRARRKAPRDQRRLDLVVLGAGGAVQVDVVDVVAARPARASASSSARSAPRPSGCGVDMWCASLASP